MAAFQSYLTFKTLRDFYYSCSDSSTIANTNTTAIAASNTIPAAAACSAVDTVAYKTTFNAFCVNSC